RGRAVELAEAKKLVREPKHPYTKALLSAVPVVDPDSKRKRIVLRDDASSAITEIPPLREVEPGHWVALRES
ncbi:MAG TPA: oligopeptide/dipeptide ABC transporter ATP-binding protein, partial [Methylomirabilota bacterium]|nr:oligopeptide/dipeptide ABC transporter ATP-binding protein [Methylomirabilota bacterium]